MKYNWKTWGRIALGVVLWTLLVFGLTSAGLVNSAKAADFRGGDYVVISADEVIDDDLFVSGQRVEVEGTVKGDLFAAANEVVVNGTVDGSLFIGGQTLQLNGQVKGSVYGSGYAMAIGRGAEIGRNMYFFGFSLETEKDSAIGRSLYTNGYQVILNGEVANDVQANSAALELNGVVGGNVDGQVSSADPNWAPPPFMPNFPGAVPMVAPGLRQGENAQIGGEVQVSMLDTEVEVDLGQSFANWFWGVLRARLGEFITLLIVGGLLLWLWPTIVQRASAEAGQKILPHAGRGCLITLIFPIALAAAMIVLILIALLAGLITFGQLGDDILSIGGVSLGLLAMVFSFILFTITKVVVAYLGGWVILTRLAKQMEPGWWLNFASLALGALIYEILRVIPILGWLFALIVILVGLGAIYVVLRQMVQPASPPDEPPPPPTEPDLGPTPEAVA